MLFYKLERGVPVVSADLTASSRHIEIRQVYKLGLHTCATPKKCAWAKLGSARIQQIPFVFEKAVAKII